MIEAPPSRYRIIEKDGRLIVFDNGRPTATDLAARGAPILASSSLSSAEGGGSALVKLLDGWARGMATWFGERWEPDGRLILRVKSGANAHTKRIWLSPKQARAYGWGLLGIAGAIGLNFPVNMLLFAVGGPLSAVLSSLATMLGVAIGVVGGLTVLLIRAASVRQTLPGG